jgi:DNA-binding MurR/RpiR family transcriptional regulator
LTSVQRIEVTINNMGNADVLSSVMNQDIDMIRRTLEETSRTDFYAAVDAIADSRKIYIMGAKSSLALATFLSYYFGLIFENVQLVDITSEAEIFEKMIRVNETDAVIGISFPRYSKRAVKAMNFASGRGAKVIAITDSPLSPLAEPADYLLLARSNMASFVDAIVAPLSLINALIVMVTLKKKDEVTEVLHSLENIWDEYGVYEKVDDKEIDANKSNRTEKKDR